MKPKSQRASEVGLSPPHRVALVALMMLSMAVLSSSLATTSAQTTTRETSGVQLNNSLPIEAKGITVDQNLGAVIPLDLPMIDSMGRKVQSGDFLDGKKPTIITLNYSDCPMLCNVQLNQLTQSLNLLELRIGADFQLLTVSIDPNESTETTRKTKSKYVEQLTNQPGAAEGWEFCTASLPVIEKLADTLGFRYRYDAVNKQYNHPAMLAFVSPDGVITRYSLSIEFPAEQMKLAIVEAGEGTVGSAVDQFILWCYSYDSNSNSYTPHAWRLMRIGGALTIGLMFACLAPYWFGRKRGPRSEQTGQSGDSESMDIDS